MDAVPTSRWTYFGLAVALLVSAARAQAQPFTFNTFAGPSGGPGSVDGTGSAARFKLPRGLATDGAGNVYVADTDNNIIRKITPAGAVSTVAGFAGAAGSNDGAPINARFSSPNGLAVDNSGTIYVADTNNHTIRKITTSGVVTTFAGSPGSVGSIDSTSGPSARFNTPRGVAVDSGGNVYVADTDNSTIRKITPAGVVSTFAGTAGSGGSADGTGSAARFSGPTGLAFDSGGNLFVVDIANQTIRKITSSGVVSTFAGTAGSGGSADGTGSAARFSYPSSIAVDASGNLYVTDSSSFIIRKITASADVTTLAGKPGFSGSDDGTGSLARFTYAYGIAVGNGGNIYVGDTFNNTIRRVTMAGVVTTFAGKGMDSGSADGTGDAARFSRPSGAAVDSSGNLYVADSDNQTIRKITPAGLVTTLAGTAGSAGIANGTGSVARFNEPKGLAVDGSGNIYVADNASHTIRLITPAGVVSTFGGTPGMAGSLDGAAAFALFNHPEGIAIDAVGTIYISDRGNQTIRRIQGGVVSTFAGSAAIAGFRDGSGTIARFYNPSGLATDSSGNVYVADSGNHVIRKITPLGAVSTLAGDPLNFGFADGTGSNATFTTPTGLAIDGPGSLYVTDSGSYTIRKVTQTSVVTTIGGSGGSIGFEDGTGSDARFALSDGDSGISGAAMTSGGNLYIADVNNDKIRLGRPAIDDAATIDFSSGPIGSPRQLSTLPNTATSWQWTIVRQPANSSATFSSTSIRSPLFTPDVADLYTFRLVASIGPNTRVSTVDLNAGPVATTTTVTTSLNPAAVGQSVTFTATVSDTVSTPTGTVTFKDGANAIGTVTLAAGQATLMTTFGVYGTHPITANYDGEPSFAPSTSNTINEIVKDTTTTYIASSLNPSRQGQAVTFTATVTATNFGTPTGDVTFKDGNTTLGTASLMSIISAFGVRGNGGPTTHATLIVSLLPGTHSITATYPENNYYMGSTSSVLSQTVIATRRADVTGDGDSDLVWRNDSTGADYLWTMSGVSTSSTSPILNVADTAWKIVGSGDFDGDGKADLLWRRDGTGTDYIWFMNGATVTAAPTVNVADSNWKVVAVADFNGDGDADIFWRNSATGLNYLWTMNGATLSSAISMPTVADLNWKVVGAGDLNGDGKSDLVWRRDGTGENYAWLLNGGTLLAATPIITVADSNWKIVAVADFDGDGKADLFWRRDGTGDDYLWQMNGATLVSASPVAAVADTNWKIVGVGDFDGDGKSDLFWRRDGTGDNYVWLMNGASITSSAPQAPVADTNWKVAAPR